MIHRPRLNDEENNLILRYRKGELKEKNGDPKPFVLSAWNYETGRMMDIDEYCAHYNLPRHDILEYKLVTHTGTPYYNTRFKEAKTVSDILNEDFIAEVIAKHIKPVKIDFKIPSFFSDEWFDRAVFSDFHNGMETDKDGIAMYATKWDKDEQERRIRYFAAEILRHQTGRVLRIDNLGDFQDGWNAQTVRGGHPLPQNKSNASAFDDGVFFLVLLIDLVAPNYDTIHLDIIVNDNHSGPFGYVTASAVKMILEMKYKHVKVTIHRSFINHYIVGKHAFVITHGKDDKTLKFGFKPKLDAIQIEKIDGYLKHYKIYQQAEFIEFSKGDSHQMLLDYCTSDDFQYFNYPAFSPSSEWIQNNFKKGRSGFVIQNVKYNENVKNIIPKFF